MSSRAVCCWALAGLGVLAMREEPGQGTGQYAPRLLPREGCLLLDPRVRPHISWRRPPCANQGEGPRCGVDGVLCVLKSLVVSFVLIHLLHRELSAR